MTRTLPIISTIVVCKDNPDELRRTLTSIAAQDYAAIEVIIVDGSRAADSCQRVAVELGFGEEHRREPDAGIYNAMNKGLERATGDVVLFMNSGDTLYSGLSLRQFVARWSKQLQEIVVRGQGVFRLESMRFINRKPVGPIHQAVFFPAAALLSQRYDESLRIGADVEFIERMSREAGAIDVPEFICEFELGGVSTAPRTLEHLLLLEKESCRLGRLKSRSDRLRFRVRMVLKMLLTRTVGYRRAFLAIAVFSRRWHRLS